MKSVRLLTVLLCLPLALSAADRLLKVDPARSYVDADVKVTVGSFTAHLDAYELKGLIDEKNRIKSGSLTFRFADLKTGNSERDAAMLEWLGGNDPKGTFTLGIFAVTPSGQGQANGSLAFHGRSDVIEFPIQFSREGDTFNVTGEANVDVRHFGLKPIRRGGLIKVDPYVKVRFKFTGTAVEAPPAAAK